MMVKTNVTLVRLVQTCLFICALFIIESTFAVEIATQNFSKIQDVQIGVLAFRGKDKTLEMWEPTAFYLGKMLPDFRFTIVPLTNKNISEAIASGSLEFVLTNSASYASLEATQGITRILTLKNRRLGNAYTKFGAIIFTRADRHDIVTIEDLKAKHFMAVHKNAFGGWWMARRELQDNGFDVFSDFKKLEFVGFPQDKIVMAIKDGVADAGTVRTDVIERMAAAGKIRVTDFKVLSQKHDSSFPFMHSTRLYPEWPLAITRITPDELAQQVAIALLQLKSDDPVALAAESAGWTVPLDYQPVHDLMRSLKVGPYESHGEVSLRDVLFQYRYWAIGITILFLMMLAGVGYITRLNRILEHMNTDLIQSKRTEHVQAQRIRKLYEVISTPGMSHDQQIKETLDFGCKTLGLEIAKVCEIDERAGTDTYIATVAPPEYNIRPGMTMDLNESLCKLVFLSERSVTIHDVSQSEYNDHPIISKNLDRAVVATPIFVNGRKFGVVSFSSRTARQKKIDSTERDLVNVIGKWVSVSLEQELARHSEVARIAAENSNQVKSVFLAHMSHEIRTPLTAIIGFAESALDASQSLSEKQDSLYTIIRNGRHLLQIINDILDLSKIEAGQLELDKSFFSPIDLLNEIEPMMRIQAIEKGLAFYITYEFPLPEKINNDDLRLKQVLINLCTNAIKFTKSGHIQVSVRCDTEAEMLYFAVVDSGIGITERQLTKIFSPYAQAQASTTKNYGGTGLGLTLSKLLAEKLGGDISVRSQFGIGSRFEVSVSTGSIQNVKLLNELRPAVDSSTSENQNYIPKVAGKILIAEDKPDNQKLLKRFLLKLGVSVDIAENGKIALEMAQSEHFDLIFMDMRMPVMDGLEAVKLLRSSGYTLPIVALTANAMKEEKQQCLEAGCDDFLPKPIDRKQLYEVAMHYINLNTQKNEAI